MRIGLVCPYDLSRPGGVQAQVLGLYRILAEGEEAPVVVGPGLPAGLEGIDLGSTVSIPVNGSRAPISLRPGVIPELKEWSATLDLLHVHEPLVPAVSLAAVRAGPPVVATFHAAPGPVVGGLYRLLGSGLRTFLGPSTRVVTAVSPSAAAPLPDDLEVRLVPNGIDVDAFTLDLPRRSTRVAFLGRDEPRKGLDVLLEAWPRVVEEVPDAELVVMGCRRNVEGVEWMGPVGDGTKAEVLASSAVYVAPNLGGESFGVTLVEAMAAGAAVVASDLTAFRGVAGEAAVFFPPGDHDALARLVSDLLKDATARNQLASRGRARATRYDWRVVAAEYRRAYAEAVP
ncbi:MAG: glycosyltransferase family 4 protein [Acidimicrobiia bacterium]